MTDTNVVPGLELGSVTIDANWSSTACIVVSCLAWVLQKPELCHLVGRSSQYGVPKAGRRWDEGLFKDKPEQVNTTLFAYLHPFLGKCGMCGQSGDGGTGSFHLCGLIIQFRNRTGGSLGVLW